MAVRVTAAEVKEVVKTSIDDSVIDSSMITNASLIVDETLSGEGLTDERLKLIELYLAAHFVTVTEERGGLITTSLGDARDEYVDVYGEGFKSSRYGQMAISLDTSKQLSAQTSSGGLQAQFRVI